MRYLLLFNKDEAKFRALDPQQRAALIARYEAYGAAMEKAGVATSGAKLEDSHAATTVRVRDGKRVLTDGPYAETVEQIAGFCVLEVADLNEALDWAARHPDAEFGSVEVRPLVPWSPS